jgi:hypothetical protein
LRLPRTPAIFGLVGFAVPIASYLVWWLAYAIGLGKILDDWNARMGVFVSLLEELVHAKGQQAHPPIFDWMFWDVLWVAVINVPLYMALGLIWRAFASQRKAAPKPL